MRLGHRVAAADHRAARHAGGARGLRCRAGAPGQQRHPVLRHRQFRVEQLGDRPDGVGAAEQDRSGDPPVGHDQLGVAPAGRVGDGENLELTVVQVRTHVTHRREIDVVGLEPRHRRGAVVLGGGVGAGDPVGDHLRLLPARLHQPVYLAAVLRALADRPHVRDVGAQRVVDDDPVLHRGADGRRQLGRRPDSGREHHEVREKFGAVVEHERSPGGVATQGDRAALEYHPHAQARQDAGEYPAAALVQLPLHRHRPGMHDGDVGAAQQQPAGGLEPEQPAPEYHRPAARARGLGDARAVLHRPEGDDVRIVGRHPLDARHERNAARREHQLVVAERRAVVAAHGSGRGVDPGHPHPGADVDVVADPPVVGPQPGVARGDAARQHVRKQDPVVRARGSAPNTTIPSRAGSRSRRRNSSASRAPAMPLPTITTRSRGHRPGLLQPHRAHLELRHPARRIECRVGEQVGAGVAGEVERQEHRVQAHRVVAPHRDGHSAAAPDDERVVPSRTPARAAVSGAPDEHRPAADASSATRRVCAPD